MEPEAPKRTLDETERRCARTIAVEKAIKYFKGKNNRSWSNDNVLTRRRNLVSHLGVDESVGKMEVEKINVQCLPLPASAIQPQESLSRWSRYIFLGE